VDNCTELLQRNAFGNNFIVDKVWELLREKDNGVQPVMTPEVPQFSSFTNGNSNGDTFHTVTNAITSKPTNDQSKALAIFDNYLTKDTDTQFLLFIHGGPESWKNMDDK
jgi:hypothetical protein